MMLIRKLGSPISSPVCRITPQSASPNFCLGIGFGRTSRQRLLEPHNSNLVKSDPACGLRRMRTQRLALFYLNGATVRTPTEQARGGLRQTFVSVEAAERVT